MRVIHGWLLIYGSISERETQRPLGRLGKIVVGQLVSGTICEGLDYRSSTDVYFNSLTLNSGFLKGSSKFYQEAAKYKNVSYEAG